MKSIISIIKVVINITYIRYNQIEIIKCQESRNPTNPNPLKQARSYQVILKPLRTRTRWCESSQKCKGHLIIIIQTCHEKIIKIIEESI